MVTRRCTQRQYLLRPDKETNNAVIYCLAVAAQRYEIDVMDFLQMSNHLSDEIMAGGFGVGLQQIRPGYGHGFDGAVFTDPKAAGIPVGEGTYQWDGAAGTWFWVDPANDLLYVGLIQRMAENSPPLQAITQTLMADAIL